jgi:hypothetical protein
MLRVVPADADAPVHGEPHDEDQALQTIGMFKLRILQFESASLEVRKGRLNGPPGALECFQDWCTAVMKRCRSGLSPTYPAPYLTAKAKVL